MAAPIDVALLASSPPRAAAQHGSVKLSKDIRSAHRRACALLDLRGAPRRVAFSRSAAPR